MRSKRKEHAKMIQRTGGSHFILISIDAVEKLKLKAQNPDCKLVEIVDPDHNQIVFKVLRLNRLQSTRK